MPRIYHVVVKLFSLLTHLSLEFIVFINVKMPIIVDSFKHLLA